MTRSTTPTASTSVEKKSGASGSKPESSSEPTPLQSEGGNTDLSAGKMLVQKIKGRENKHEKAIRMLVSGRLRVLRVDSDFIAATCRGDSGEIYNLLWRDQRWACSCPARTDCSHLVALWCVTAVER